MRKPRLLLLISILFWARDSQWANAVPFRTVPEGKLFPSPDGRFIVQLVTPAPTQELVDLVPRISGSGDLRDAEPKYELVQHAPELVIKEKVTGRVNRFSTLTPLFSIRWTGNSKTVVVTYHLAGWTGVYVFSFHAGEWEKHEIEPPLDDDFRGGRLTRQKLGQKNMELTYKIMDVYRDPADNRINADYYICTYAVNGASGALTPKDKKVQISSSKFDQIRYHGDH